MAAKIEYGTEWEAAESAFHIAEWDIGKEQNRFLIAECGAEWSQNQLHTVKCVSMQSK